MDKLIFSDIAQIKKHTDVSSNTEIENYQSAIKQAQAQFIVPLIGKACLNDLLEKLKTDDLTGDESELVEQIRYPVAILTQLLGLASQNISLTNGGFTVPAGENVAVASQHRVDAYKLELESTAQFALNSLLEWLEENGDQIPLYDSSDEKKRNQGRFLRKASDFQEYTTLTIGHFMFSRLLPVIAMVEENVIRTALCDTLYEHMRQTLETGGDLGVYEPLMKYIKPVVAHFALSDSIEEMNLTTQGENLILRFSESVSNYAAGKEPVDSPRIIRLMNRNVRMGKDAINRLEKHLRENAADYPIYEASECNPEDILLATTIHENKSGAGIML